MNKQEIENNVVFHNRYELIERLGKGGFSTVWKAKDKMSDLEIAIKIFLKQDQEGIELCREEYRKTYNLEHPSVLRPFHFDVSDQQPYIVMPYLSGGSLEKLVGVITIDQFTKLYQQLSSAIDYLHSSEQQIIHGDIKPDNILMDHKGNFYLTDFGISQRLENSFTMTLGSHYTSQSSYSSKGITPMAFRAPEHFNFKDWKMMGALPASDLWAFGISMHHLIEGEIAFSGEGGLGQLIMMSSGNLSLSEIVSLNEPFTQYEQHIFKCLQLKPEEREIVPLGKSIEPTTSAIARTATPVVTKISTNDLAKQEVIAQVGKHKKNEKPHLGYLKKAIGIGFALMVCIVGFGFWMSQESSEIQLDEKKDSSYLEYYQPADNSARENLVEEDFSQTEFSITYSDEDKYELEIDETYVKDDDVVEERVESSSNIEKKNHSEKHKVSNPNQAIKRKESVQSEPSIVNYVSTNEVSEVDAVLKEDVIQSSLSLSKNTTNVSQENITELNAESSETLKKENVIPQEEIVVDEIIAEGTAADENVKAKTVLNKTYLIKLSPSKNFSCHDQLNKGDEISFDIKEAISVNGQVVFVEGETMMGRVNQFKCNAKGITQNIVVDFRNHVLPDGSKMRFKNLSIYLKNKENSEYFGLTQNEIYTLQFVGRNEYDFKKFIYSMYEN